MGSCCGISAGRRGGKSVRARYFHEGAAAPPAVPPPSSSTGSLSPSPSGLPISRRIAQLWRSGWDLRAGAEAFCFAQIPAHHRSLQSLLAVTHIPSLPPRVYGKSLTFRPRKQAGASPKRALKPVITVFSPGHPAHSPLRQIRVTASAAPLLSAPTGAVTSGGGTGQPAAHKGSSALLPTHRSERI